MAETDWHRDQMIASIQTLGAFFAADPRVYVSGNLIVCYQRGDRRRHVAPDVFVVKDVPKKQRDHYLIWEEGKGPDFVTEYTSRSTKEEDIDDKFWLYRDVLKVREYFLFDPKAEYLDPPLQGYRLQDGDYVRIEPVDGRLPSEVLGLHLERHGNELRFYNPATGQWLPTPEEAAAQAEAARDEQAAARQQAEAAQQQEAAARQQAEAARQQEAQARQQAETAQQQEAQARQQAEAEVERLRCEVEELRRKVK